MATIVYQGKGIKHKRYIRDAAFTIWRFKCGNERIAWSARVWNDCVREAMKQHREYLSQGTEVRIIEDMDISEPFENEHFSG